MFDSAAEKRKKSMPPRQGAMQAKAGTLAGTAASSASSTSSQQGYRVCQSDLIRVATEYSLSFVWDE